MARYRSERAQKELERITTARSAEPETVARHKCFLAHHADDAEEVLTFVQDFGSVMIPRSIGVQDDDYINSDDDAYVMSRIRQKYLADTTVTIVMLGACTWSRKYVDWEIYSSLRTSSTSAGNGLMSVRLPSGAGAAFPERLDVNLNTGSADGYARAWTYPATSQELRACIDDAFVARSTRARLVAPAAPRWERDLSC